MTEMAIRIKRNPYFALGFGAVLLACAAQLLNLNTSLTSLLPRLEWQMVTGIALVAILAFQWSLFVHKQTKNIQAIPRNRTLHKYAGIGFIVIFALHADSVGYAWMMLLSAILAGLIFTGLFNREIVVFRKQWTYKTWLWLHVALAAMLTPFVVMHAVVALIFE